MFSNLLKVSKCVWSFLVMNIIYLYAFLIFVFLLYSFRYISILKIVIWPSLILYLAILFKKEILNLFRRLESLNVGSAAILTFTQQNFADSQPDNVISLQHIIDNGVKDDTVDVTESTLASDLNQQIKKLNLELEYEKIYNLLFQSQIDFLWLLQNKKQIGINQSQIETYVVELQTKYPLSYPKTTWNDYIHLILARKLIALNDDNGNFVITEFGSNFLNYVTIMNYKKYLIP